MDMFQKYHVNDGIATDIASFLYGEKEQLAALSNYSSYEALFDREYHAFHLIDEWISIDTKVLSNQGIIQIIVYSIDYCTKDCCVLVVVRNANNSIETIASNTSSCYFYANL